MISKELFNISGDLFAKEFSAKIIYKKLAEIEKDPNIKAKLVKLSLREERHEIFWRVFFRGRNVKFNTKQSAFKILLLVFLRRIFGLSFLLALMEFMERESVEKYVKFLEEASLTASEKVYIKEIIAEELIGVYYFYNKIISHFSPYVKNIIIGLNDGLVEILGTALGLSFVFPRNPFIIFLIMLIETMVGSVSLFVSYYMAGRFQRETNNSVARRFKLLFNFLPEKTLEEVKNKLLLMGVDMKLSERISEVISVDSEISASFLLAKSLANEFKSALYVSFSYIFAMIFPSLPFLFINSTWFSLLFTVSFVVLSWLLTAVIITSVSQSSIKQKFLELSFMTLITTLVSYGLGNIFKQLLYEI